MTAVSGVSGNTEDTETLIAEARKHVESVAQSLPGFMADRLRAGESDYAPRVALIVRLTNALEAVAVSSVVDRDTIVRALVKANNDYSHGVLLETQKTSRLDYLADAVVAVLNEGIR